MLINQDFSVDRAKYLGGSDIGAVLGVSKFKSPLEIWLEKTGKEVVHKDSLPMRFGNFAEQFVADEYSRATGFELLSDPCAHIHPNHVFMAAHVDRFILGDGPLTPPTKILECKTANIFAQSDWGGVGTDEVPLSYLAQCTWYMSITQMDCIDLAVLFGGHDFRIYELFRDKELEELVIQKANYFWSEFVVKDLPPPPSNESDCQLLFSKGDESKAVVAKKETLELTKRLQVLNSEIEQREKEASTIKKSIMEVMGEAETLSFNSKVLATWKSPKQSFRLDSKRLEAEHPGLASTYKIPIQNSRRLVVKHFD